MEIPLITCSVISYECFRNSGTPKSSMLYNRVFHCKPSILGYLYFWKHPYSTFCIFRALNGHVNKSTSTCSSPPRHQAPVCNTQKKAYCTYFTHFTYVPQPGVGWGGGGVGCNDMHCHVTIALAHMLDATQLHLRTCWMLRNCTCAHVGCYAIALAHMLDATQLHLRTCSMLRNRTCAHVGCYAIALAHMFDATQLHLRTCSMLRNCTCAHPLDPCPKHISVAYSK